MLIDDFFIRIIPVYKFILEFIVCQIFIYERESINLKAMYDFFLKLNLNLQLLSFFNKFFQFNLY